MGRSTVAFLLLGCALRIPAQQASFPFAVAQSHEVSPRRHNIPLAGINPGFNQLKLKLTVSPVGKVLSAEASGAPQTMEFWPRIQDEIKQWQFTPFQLKGVAVTAEVEEYVNLVPPERLPATHVAPPPIRPDSDIAIALERSVCFGSCPAYTVTIRTSGVEFDGVSNVAALGKHSAAVDPHEVTQLAAKFVAADFYSMDAAYSAPVTDIPGYSVSISIDGNAKTVRDYAGEWVGMPQVITQLEKDVEDLAGTERWIKGPPKPTAH
jgi:hypothetical protein